jgi:hypothetical protein
MEVKEGERVPIYWFDGGGGSGGGGDGGVFRVQVKPVGEGGEGGEGRGEWSSWLDLSSQILTQLMVGGLGVRKDYKYEIKMKDGVHYAFISDVNKDNA